MHQERKLVTVLFADIVDSTGSARAFDPEVLRDALARTFGRAREVLVAHGATVEKFIGDAVMAVFGLPVTHDDDAVRAVRAALALRSLSGGPTETVGPRFTFRIGVNSGEVVAGDGQGGEFLVTGQAVVMAARLEQSAAPGEILVGPLTRDLTARSIRYGPARAIQAKGIGVIQAAPALGTAPEPARRSAGTFVGRDAELRLLLELHERAVATRRPHLVTIFGEAGVGKSRLAAELMTRLAPVPAVRAACLPYGHAITYWPLQELIRAEAGIVPTDGLDAARTKIEAIVTGTLDSDEQEMRSTARELAALALADRADAGSEVNTEERRHELVRAIRLYLEGRLRSTSAAIVLEDLHWGEAPLLGLLEKLLDQLRAPLLLVCLARPELMDRLPTWGAGRTNALALRLGPLSASDAERLARELLKDASDGRVREIVERTEGNPLFVEEYVRMLAERGSDAVVPPTLQGVIAARLDATSSTLKRLLQEASVLGRDFWLEALPGATSSSSRATDIAEAERRDLVVETRRRGPSGATTYRFTHGLIRDVAYSSLSKADRSRAHDHYARWLAAAAGERAQEYSEIVAYHAERAFELAREVDAPTTTELGRRAFETLTASGGGARERADFLTALELYDRALAVADAIGVTGTERALAQGMAAITRLRWDPSMSSISEVDRAIEATRGLGPTEHLVRLLIWRGSTAVTLDDVVAARALFAEAVLVAGATGDPDVLAYALWASSEPAGVIGQLDEQHRILEQALEHVRVSGAVRWMVSCLADISANAIERGDVGAALKTAEECVATAERTGRLLDRFKAANALARGLVATGDQEALAAAERAFALAKEIGGPGALARGTEVLCEACERIGDLDRAGALLDDALGVLDAGRMPTMRAVIARLEVLRSRLRLTRGDVAGARRSADRAMELTPKAHAAASATAALAAAEVATASGNESEARQLAEQALAVLSPTGHRLLRARVERFASSLGAPSPGR